MQTLVCVRVFIIAVVFLVLGRAANTSDKNLMTNGGFERGQEGKAVDWYTGGWGGATGRSERCQKVAGLSGTYGFVLERKNAAGGLQLVSPLTSFQVNCPLRITFRFMGQGYMRLGIYQKKGGAAPALKHPLNNKPLMIVRYLKSEGWQNHTYEFSMPTGVSAEGAAFRLYFVLTGEHKRLFLDDVVVRPLSSASSLPKTSSTLCPIERSERDWLQVIPPKDLTPAESEQYGEFPKPAFEFAMKDGVLTRNGIPFFYAGSFTNGGGQWNVASAWLARLQKNSYATVTWGIGRPATAVKAIGQGDERRLQVTYKDSAPLYSWIRELGRYGLLTQFDPGNAMYKYNPFRRYTKAFPGLKDFYVQGSHFYCFDHNTDLGRQFHFNAWKNYFRYIRQAPLLAFECYNELGYTPTHARVLADFRKYAQRKYGSLSKANACWGENFPTWDRVAPPHAGPGKSLLSYGELLAYLKECRKRNIYDDWILPESVSACGALLVSVELLHSKYFHEGAYGLLA